MQTDHGIETVLALAAVDPDFAARLLEDRDAALEASGVALSPTQRQVLRTIPPAALRGMIERFCARIPEHDRRSFLGRSATALLTLVAGTSVLGAGGGGYGGIQPDRPGLGLGRRPRTWIAVEALWVKGGLEQEIVRRIIRRHINELRYPPAARSRRPEPVSSRRIRRRTYQRALSAASREKPGSTARFDSVE
jgi:hypothetical protein